MSLQDAENASNTPTPLPHRRLDAKARVALGVAALLLLMSAGATVFIFGYYQPAARRAEATATSIAESILATQVPRTQTAQTKQTQVADLTATTTASQHLYTQVTSAQPFINEPFEQPPNSGDLLSWPDRFPCQFQNGSYEITQLNPGTVAPCIPPYIFPDSNFAVQVDMKLSQGNGGGGIMFDNYGGYTFVVHNDGSYELNNYFLQPKTPLVSGKISSFHSDQTNQLTVILYGHSIYLYANQHFLNSILDNYPPDEILGLIAEADQSKTVVDYNNFKAWQIS